MSILDVFKVFNMVAESTRVLTFLFLYWIYIFDVKCGQVVMAQTTQTPVLTTVVATAPMPEVKEGGIIALHCKVTKFQSNSQKIVIYREINREPVLLTLEDNIIVKKPEYFLATRLLSDSIVHFLTKPGATKDDEGRYICKVLDSTLKVIRESSVEINILYFPKGTSPKCSPHGEQSYRVQEGSLVTFNCSSEKANPQVKIAWSRTPGKAVEPYVEVAKPASDIIYNIITFRPRRNDDSAIFTCRVTSKMFPNEKQECHIGPLKVIPNEYVVWPVTSIPETVTRYQRPLPKPKPRPPQLNPPLVKYTNNNNTAEECHDYCTEVTQKSVSRWTIATIVSGLLALLFFIIGIILLIRYCFATEAKPQTPTRTDDINIHRMDYRIDGNRLYMTLERPGPSQTEAVYRGGEIMEREYIGTPIRDIEVIAIGAQGGHFSYPEGQISSPSEKGEVEHKLKTPTPEEAECTIAISPSGEMDRKSSMGTPTKGESEKESDRESLGTPTGMLSAHGTLTKGESERLINGTPTLPPRRYRSKSQFV